MAHIPAAQNQKCRGPTCDLKTMQRRIGHSKSQQHEVSTHYKTEQNRGPGADLGRSNQKKRKCERGEGQPCCGRNEPIIRLLYFLRGQESAEEEQIEPKK